MMIELERLHELLDYNADTGVFVWSSYNSRNTRKGMVAGTKLSNRYIRIFIFGKLYQAHRLAWYMYYGKEPEYGIDHIDGDKHNNRISNLRDVPQSSNCKNKSISSANSSGFTGVTFLKSKGKWRSRICINGKDVHLGFFDEKGHAIRARAIANKKYGFSSGHGRGSDYNDKGVPIKFKD
jgi:hypothetical protein